MCFSFRADIHPDELKEIGNAQTAAKSFELFYKENPEGFWNHHFSKCLCPWNG